MFEYDTKNTLLIFLFNNINNLDKFNKNYKISLYIEILLFIYLYLRELIIYILNDLRSIILVIEYNNISHFSFNLERIVYIIYNINISDN